MKIYEMELRLKDRFAAKSEKEAKEEMVRRIQIVLKGKILWRIQLIATYEV